ncbi:glycosyltransferase family 4 protein [Candidatus Omnitrophota bacterium]
MRYLPHYRLGVFNRLCGIEDIDIYVHTSAEFPGGFSLVKPSKANFKLVDRRVCRLRIPFTKKSVDFIPSAIRNVLMGGYDVFVFSNRMSDLGLWINLVMGRLLGRRICLWGHGITRRDGKWGAKLRKVMMRMTNANILYSESGRNKALEMGLAPEKLFVAYNALDTQRSQSIRKKISEDDIKRFRLENDLQDKKIVFFSGRLVSDKKPDILVRAMGEVARQNLEVLVLIVGDGPMRAELESLVKELELENFVRFLGAQYDEEIMAKYLFCASVAAMPAHAGLAIQHAFDFGVPIIVGDDMKEHPPEIELVENGETGIFCKDGDANEFAKAILCLLTNEDERQRMSANCRKLIERKYNVENMAKGILDAITHAAKINEEMT